MKFNRLIGYGALLVSLSSYSNGIFDQVCTQQETKRLENICQVPEIRESFDNIKDNYEIVISREQNKLYLFSNGIKIDEFMVSTGKKNTPTQDGIYFIKSKTKNPDWYFKEMKSMKKYKKLIEKYPDGIVPALNPDNPILGYWIELKKLNSKTKLHHGIHGTSGINYIGKNVSGGCIRMLKKDLENIVKLPNGTIVRIE